MKKEKIIQSLEEKFNEPLPDGAIRHIVFWYDEDKSFDEIVTDIELDDVKIHRVENNYFKTKVLLEREDTKSNYLLYIPSAKPQPEENWLLGILLYSQEFSADKASLTLQELELDNIYLKKSIKKFAKFFNSQKRLNDCKSLLHNNPSEKQLLLAMLATLTSQKSITFEYILREILTNGLEKNETLKNFQKYGLEEAFWDFVEEHYSYKDDKPTLSALFTSLTITHFLYLTKPDEVPDDWKQFQLSKLNNAFVFIDHWMKDKDDSDIYDKYSSQVEQRFNIERKLQNYNTDKLIECDTFRSIDKQVIRRMIEVLVNGVEEFERYKDYLEARRNKHWYSQFKHIYQALYYGILLKEFRVNHQESISIKSRKDAIDLYRKEYFKVDQYYRCFYRHFDRVDSDILIELGNYVGKLYKNWYLAQLGKTWDEVVEEEQDEAWWIPGIDSQKDFYESYVQPILDDNVRNKVFVLISDALRYEVAEQLKTELDKETRSEISIKSMQTGLPSTTAMGMAMLLPHESISLNKKGEVLIDENRTSGLKNREKILKLKEKDSVAVKWQDFNKLSREEKREITKSRVIYIYHDTIDAVGDNSKKEDEVFEATRKAINELKEIINEICNALNGSKILVTSDHGFAYSRDSLEETDVIEQIESESVLRNKRFAITEKEYKDLSGIHQLSLNSVINNKDQSYSIISPKSYMRFKSQGGGRNFVHGGISLQEIVIPLIKYRHIRNQAATEDQKPSKVDIELKNISREITNNTFMLNFFQLNPVGGKNNKRRVKIAMWDLSAEPVRQISNEQIITFDSKSQDPEDRQFRFSLSLKQGDYDKSKAYFLRVMDIEEKDDYGTEYLKEKFRINIVIPNDFDF